MKHLVLLSAIFLFLFTSCVDRNAFSIYCIGDSTMANKTEDVVPETGWCQVLDQYINGPITIKNHARNGRSTKSFINEGLWETVLDSLQKGDFVFIQFGHNDQKDYDTLRYTRPFSTFSDNLRKFVNESREKGANPVLFTSIVRRKFDENGKLKDTHGDYAVATRKVATEMEVPLIDLQKLTEEWINNLGDEPSKKMYVWTDILTSRYSEPRMDDTHLSEVGARHVAKMAVQSLAEIIPLFKKYQSK